MSAVPCPYGEQELLPVALGQSPPDDLQVHLTACSTCRQRVERLQRESAALRKAALDPYQTLSEVRPATPAPTDSMVQSIGKYVVVGRLGEGAQAAAYRAVHPNLPRDLAIKLAHAPVRPGSEQHDLLVREGRHLAQLEHANIARVFDLDFHQGRPFLVMEYHKGVNLQQHAKSHKLTPREAARLLIPLARAADAAHRLGIVHQDIKPANILIAETGTPYLLDFGLAQLADAWNGADAQPIGGTAAYMAPEQARGDPKSTPATDIFALGGVLYFLLTGHAPFHGRDSHEAMQHAGRCDFDRSALRKRSIPRRLAAICLRAMAADPGERYARGEDFAADLERYLRRSRRLVALTVGVAVLCLLFGVWYVWPQPVPEPPAEQPLITLIERGKSRPFTPKTPADLANLLPLRPDEHLELTCEVPRGFQAAFFLVDTTGAIRHLTPQRVSRAGAFDRVRFPAEHVWTVEGPPGTALFLAFASRRSQPLLGDLLALLEQDKLAPLPAPAEDVLLILNRDAVEPYGEVLRPVNETPYSRLRARLERLRERAVGRFDYVWGAALPVR